MERFSVISFCCVCFFIPRPGSVRQVGLETMAQEAGIDLYKLRFSDGSESRKQWCARAPHFLTFQLRI